MESFACNDSNKSDDKQDSGGKKKAPSFKEILAEKTFLPRIGTHDNVIRKNGKTFSCSLCSCELELKELKPHVTSKKHNQILKDCRWLEKCIDKEKPLPQVACKDNEEPSPPGVEMNNTTSCIQDTIDRFVARPLLGLEYILEIVYESKSKPSLYLCTLCHRKGNISMALSHMTGFYHTVLYIKKHFPTAFRHFGCKNINDIPLTSKPVMLKIAKAIEATYGRLKLTRVEAEKFWDNETQYFKALYEGKHFSESSGETFENFAREEMAKVSGVRPEVNSIEAVQIEERFNHREVPRKEKKIDDYANKLEVFYKLSKDIDGEMEQLLIKHKQCPEDHPKYNEEWKKFWKERYRDLQLRGIDPSSFDFKSEWKEFWSKRILKLHDEETESKKMVLRRMLNLEDDPTHTSFASFNKDREVVLRDDDSLHSRNSSKKRYRSRSPQGYRDSPSRRRESPNYRELSPRHKRSRRFRESNSGRFSPPPFRSISPPFIESSLVERDHKVSSDHLKRDSPPRYRELNYSPPRYRELDYSPPRFRDPRDSPSRFRDSRDAPGFREFRASSPPYFSGSRDSPPFKEAGGSRYSRRDSSPRFKEFRDTSPCFRDLRYSPPASRESHSHRGEVSSHFREPSPYQKSPFSHKDYNSYSEYERSQTTEKDGTNRMKKLSDESSTFRRESSEIAKIEERGKSRDSQDNTGNSDNVESKVVTLLRLLTGLEKRLGSLGPRVIGMLSNALIMENNKFNSSEELLENESNRLLLETVREKLKGHLLAGLVHGVQREIFNTAVKDIETTIENARRKKGPKNIVNEPDIIENEKISKNVVNNFLVQGNKDTRGEELNKMMRVSEDNRKQSSSIIIDITSDDEFSADNKKSARKIQENEYATKTSTNQSSTSNINIISGIPGGSITINEFSIGGTFGNAQNFYRQDQERHEKMIPQQDPFFQLRKSQPLSPGSQNPYALSTDSMYDRHAIDVENSGSGHMLGHYSNTNAKWSMGSSLLVKPLGFPQKKQSSNIPIHTKQTFPQMEESAFRGRASESLLRGVASSNQPMSKDSSFVWKGEQSDFRQERGGDLRGEMTEPRREHLNFRDGLLDHREITTGIGEYSSRTFNLAEDYRRISNFTEPQFNYRRAF